MNMKWNDERLAEAVKRHNAMVRGLAIAVPLVSEALNGARITGYKVDKRTRAKVDAIIKANMPTETWARCYLQTGYEYTVYLFADFNSPVDEHSVAYAELTVSVAQKDGEVWRGEPGHVGNETTIEEMLRLKATAEHAELEARKASDAAFTAKMALGSFVNS